MKRIFATTPIEHHRLRQCAVQARKNLLHKFPRAVFLVEPSRYGWTVFKGEGAECDK